MKIQILCFTKTGYELAEKLTDTLQDHETVIEYRGKADCMKENAVGNRPKVPLAKICEEAFASRTALVFIGAMGIAIRHIAPYVKDKLSDPPVLVMDEKAYHVIPVLSGHVGGANELAVQIAQATGADPVITTATDLQKAFSVDLFAKEHGLEIVNRDGIAKVSVKALEGKPVTISIKDYPPAVPVDVVVTDETEQFVRGTIALRTKADSGMDRENRGTKAEPGMDRENRRTQKTYTVGIGCKKGKPLEQIEPFVLSCLQKAGISIGDVYAIASIDLKENEEGLQAFSKKYSLPFLTYESSVLAKVQGDFSASSFVKETTGVENVCERAAVLAAGPAGKLVVRKEAENGMTCAVAKRNGLPETD